eukprot:scaffold480_cov257-Pinguiococcus_pyrenoidosus.AAC.1
MALSWKPRSLERGRHFDTQQVHEAPLQVIHLTQAHCPKSKLRRRFASSAHLTQCGIRKIRIRLSRLHQRQRLGRHIKESWSRRCGARRYAAYSPQQFVRAPQHFGRHLPGEVTLCGSQYLVRSAHLRDVQQLLFVEGVVEQSHHDFKSVANSAVGPTALAAIAACALTPRRAATRRRLKKPRKMVCTFVAACFSLRALHLCSTFGAPTGGGVEPRLFGGRSGLGGLPGCAWRRRESDA